MQYLKEYDYVVIEDWETWKDAIERKEVHISTIGRNKAGKSTMLNALMHARYNVWYAHCTYIIRNDIHTT